MLAAPCRRSGRYHLPILRLFDSDQFSEIIDALAKNRTRTLLTAFGIFWGIFMLLLLMGGGNGLQSMLGNNFAGFASNSGFIFAERTSMPFRGFRQGGAWHLTLEDVDRIKTCVPELKICTPALIRWGARALSDNHSCGISLYGIRADYNLVDNPKIRVGRQLSEADHLQRRKVCVVGSRVVEELFPELGKTGDPCGRYVQVDSTFFRIVGVSAKEEGGINIGGNPTTTVYLPFGTMQQSYNRGRNVDNLCLVAHDRYSMSEVQTRVEQILKRTHLIHPDDTRAVTKVNAESIFSMIDSLFAGVSILVWMIGLGTLLAGAIGVSNIMIVTVRERTNEIGIRRAIGATPRDIVTMVMSESIVLTLLAGMSGITFAVLVLQALEVGLSSPTDAYHFQITFGLAVGAASLLALLGLLAGLAPALRAMKIKPVDAMQEE